MTRFSAPTLSRDRLGRPVPVPVPVPLLVAVSCLLFLRPPHPSVTNTEPGLEAHTLRQGPVLFYRCGYKATRISCKYIPAGSLGT